MTPRRNKLETAIVAAAPGTQRLGARLFHAENLFSVPRTRFPICKSLPAGRELSQNVFDAPHGMWEDLSAPKCPERWLSKTST